MKRTVCEYGEYSIWEDMLITLPVSACQTPCPTFERLYMPAGSERDLDDITGSVADIYDEALVRIKMQPVMKSRLAMNVLMWISHAKKPLSVDQVRHVLALSDHLKQLDRDRLRSPKILVDVCAGMVNIEAESNNIRLTHYTVQEYLQCHSEFFPDSDIQIARVCLQYLLLEEFAPYECIEETEDLLACKRSMPLVTYAISYWPQHARGKGEAVLEDLILAVLRSQRYALFGNFLRNFREYSTPLEVIVYNGLAQILQVYTRDNVVEPENYGRALGLASRIDNTESDSRVISQMLLQAELRDYQKGRIAEPTALPHAAWCGRYDVVQQIVEMGFDDQASFNTIGRGDTALHFVSWSILRCFSFFFLFFFAHDQPR